MEITYTPANNVGFNYNMTDGTPEVDCNVSSRCEGQIPGSPMHYLANLGRLELLGIPQIYYEPIRCNSNQEKLIPDLYQTATGTEIKTYSTSTVSSGSPAFTAQNDISVNHFNLAQYYNSEGNTFDTDGNGVVDTADANTPVTLETNPAVYKHKISKPDIFSENEFLCCVKLGEPTPSANNCCSGHAVYTNGDPDQGMHCRLPFGANLNVYFNRFVSSDGLLEDATLRGDEDPIGFLQSQFNPITGEIIPNEDTDEILEKLGEKYCTGDSNNFPTSFEGATVRRGAAIGNFNAGPSLFYRGDEHPDTQGAQPSTDYRFKRLSIVDDIKDSETSANDPSLSGPVVTSRFSQD